MGIKGPKYLWVGGSGQVAAGADDAVASSGPSATKVAARPVAHQSACPHDPSDVSLSSFSRQRGPQGSPPKTPSSMQTCCVASVRAPAAMRPARRHALGLASSSVPARVTRRSGRALVPRAAAEGASPAEDPNTFALVRMSSGRHAGVDGWCGGWAAAAAVGAGGGWLPAVGCLSPASSL